MGMTTDSEKPLPAARVRHPAATKAHSAPRKVIIASTLARFAGSLDTRLTLASRLIDDAAQAARTKYANRGPDLIVFPEFALIHEGGTTAAERAVELAGPVLERLGAKAREHHAWIVLPMILKEPGATGLIRNAAVLLNRSGAVAGIFHKVHCMIDDRCMIEGGVTPGGSYPVFDCDFGRLGILLCWDMAYNESWDALAAGGAEIVALPSSSPQTLRPMAQALRHSYYVVSSAPRDNASLFDPIGRTVAQVTEPGVMVHEIDLAHAILHWSEKLHEGQALTERFGTKVGYNYSEREDTGVFWSNDPQRSIGEMIRELGLVEMREQIERMRRPEKR